MPSPKRVFAIGDIHGCYQALDELLKKLPLKKGDRLVFLGDYIDRGNNSQAVVSRILELKKNFDVVTLMGNHELMLLCFLNDPTTTVAGAFIYNGGITTLGDYGQEDGSYQIPHEHLNFFENLSFFHVWENYCFVHAAFPNVSIDEVDVEEHGNYMLWARDEFYRSDFEWGKVMVHGHTPIEECFITERRINVDTGCVYGNKLTAIELPSKKLYSVENVEKLSPQILKDHTSRRVAVRFDGPIPGQFYIDEIEKPVDFTTINYNPYGMLVSVSIAENLAKMSKGDLVKGHLEFTEQQEMGFKGRIIRKEAMSNFIQYAIQIDSLSE